MKKLKRLITLGLSVFLMGSSFGAVRGASRADAAVPTSPAVFDCEATGWSTSGGINTINDINWSYGAAGYLAKSTGFGVQIGSKQKPQTSGWTISTAVSNFGTGATITKVAINAKTGESGTYDISVGGTSYKSGNLSTSLADYATNNISVNSGNIQIKIVGTIKAAYLKTITVTYSLVTKYTVTFNSNDGSSVDSQSIEKGKYASKPTDPTKDGAAFSYWYLDDENTEFDFVNTPINSDITLNAKWVTAGGSRTVSFNTNGGSTIDDVTAYEGNEYKISKPTNPTRDGYAFSYWYADQNDDTTEFNFENPIPSDGYTLYAKWISNNKKTISFNSDGGSAVDSIIAEEIQSYAATKPADPTKDHFIFEYWYLDGDSNRTEVDFTKGFGEGYGNSINLVAKWKNPSVTLLNSSFTTNTYYTVKGIVTFVQARDKHYIIESNEGAMDLQDDNNVLSGVNAGDEIEITGMYSPIASNPTIKNLVSGSLIKSVSPTITLGQKLEGLSNVTSSNLNKRIYVEGAVVSGSTTISSGDLMCTITVGSAKTTLMLYCKDSQKLAAGGSLAIDGATINIDGYVVTYNSTVEIVAASITKTAIPTVIVSGSTVIKEDGQSDLTLDISDIDDTSSVIWALTENDDSNVEIAVDPSDNTKATITGKNMGTAKLTVTVGETSSMENTIYVYPKAEELSISEAIDVANNVSGTKSDASFTYKVKGKVKSGSGTTDIVIEDIQDSSKTIKVHGSGLCNTEGTKVVITGLPYVYSSNPQIGNASSQVFYYVSFTNGNSEYASTQEVNANGLATKPAVDPTPAQTYISFEGWRNGAEGEVWDFTQPVTSDLDLVASFVNSAAETFSASLDPKQSIGFKYTKEEVQNPGYKAVSDPSSLKDGDKILISTTIKNDDYEDRLFFAKNKPESSVLNTIEKTLTSGVIPQNDSDVSNLVFTVLKDSDSKFYLRFKDGNYFSNSGNTSIASTNDSTEKKDLTFNSNNVLINGSRGLFGKLASGTVSFKFFATSNFGSSDYSDSITIYKLESNSYTDVEFRIKLGVSMPKADVLEAAPNATKFGFKLTSSVLANPIVYDFMNETENDAENNDDDYYYYDAATGFSYVIISLGDVLNNISRITDEFTIQTYITTPEGDILGTPETFSLKSLVQAYYDAIDALPEAQGEEILNLAVIFEELGVTIE